MNNALSAEHRMAVFPREIEIALSSHPLCWQIVGFLIQHEGAMDTIKGIAKFWVGCDELAAQSALDCLFSAGVVVAQVLRSGVYYSLTTDPYIRSWLRERIQAGPALRPKLRDLGLVES